MQDERKEDVEETEEVEAHKRFGPEDPERLVSRSDEEGSADEEDVEAHHFRTGPEEFGKRF